MARIEGVRPDRAGAFARFVYRLARRRFGFVPEPAAVMAHHGAIMGAYGTYETLAERARLVERRLKVLASLKTATLVGCRF